MNAFAIMLLSILEVVALVVITRLWLRRRHRLVPRVLWSLILLIPLFGVLMYVFFLLSDFEKNPDRTDTQSDSDAFYGGNG